MILITSNDYYDFLEKVLERYEAGELSEEEARQMINDVDVSDYKADPRPIADIPAEWSTIIATPIIANKTNDYVTKDTKQVNRGE